MLVEYLAIVYSIFQIQIVHSGDQGVFHVELKYTSRGPRLIEVNCRMGGGPVRDVNLLVWGVDLVEEHLLTSAGTQLVAGPGNFAYGCASQTL